MSTGSPGSWKRGRPASSGRPSRSRGSARMEPSSRSSCRWPRGRPTMSASSPESCRDISDRKNAEIELKRVSRQQELILNAAGEGILGLDANGNTQFVNAAAVALLGYESNELVGRPQHVTVHHSRIDGTPLPQEESPILDRDPNRQRGSGEGRGLLEKRWLSARGRVHRHSHL